ncbi:serum amyloid P-component-like isoform X1 [Oreochromis niloticus]|uniref:Serum amyloid P-component-like n=2 Tax=Oreochromis niloticus TaxID=8128 RepID=A0A669DRD0_ORENI|nr:serum amyloid P-component-like isoform X1 [Oreochromis niloticus]
MANEASSNSFPVLKHTVTRMRKQQRYKTHNSSLFSSHRLDTDLKMALLILLVMLTACAAVPQDLSGKMFIFPQETDTANVRLNTSMQSFTAVTACFRSITDLSRNHNLFSLSTPSFHNGFLVFKEAGNNVIDIYVRNNRVTFTDQDYMLNTWQSICTTWDSESELVQLWLNGKPSIKKFIGGSVITDPIVIVGQEQDSHGGGFDINQSFVGMMSDVHMWNYVLSPCEIQRFIEDLNFTPGNVINWRALEFEATGRVLVENKITCE